MSKNIKLFIVGVFFIAAAYKIQAHDQHHLECWHCSSDTIGAEDFCGTTFQEDNIPTDLIKERNINLLRNCNSTIHNEHERPVCRKTVEEYDGKTITKRFCYYTNKSDNLDHCNVTSTEKNVRRIFCEDCLENKCNSGTQMAAIVGGIFASIFVSNLFTY